VRRTGCVLAFILVLVNTTHHWIKTVNYQKIAMPASPSDQVMTLEELAGYLKIPKSTLYKLVQEGRVPGQKLGKQWRFAKTAIDRWLDSEQANNQGGQK
jgi:excisionase family DNA binding protein